MKTQYLVLPHRLGVRNRVEARQAEARRTHAEALRTGERMARRCCGAPVISQSCDEVADFAADPVVLAIHGTVPDRRDTAEVAA